MGWWLNDTWVTSLVVEYHPLCAGGSLRLNTSLAGLHCADLLSSKDRVVLPSVHLSPGGGEEDRRGEGGWRGLDLGSHQWSRNSRHRMVDRWVDQVTRSVKF